MKRILSIFLMLALAATILCVPTAASAESLDNLTYTPPAGYTDSAMRKDTRTGNTFADYLLPNGSQIQVGRNVWQHGAQSVHDKTDMEWLDFIEAQFGGREKTFANMLAKFVNINGYDYVKITFGHEEDSGTFYYNTAYIGGPNCEYVFLYADPDASKPNDGILRAVVESAQYGGTAPAPAPADNTIKIYVNGNRIISDADPVIVNGRTLVPIRAVAEAMGCTVTWNDFTRSVRIQKGDLTVDLIIDDTIVLKMRGTSFEEIRADVPATIIGSRTFVPVRVVAEAFGAKVDWDGNTRSVIISTGGQG